MAIFEYVGGIPFEVSTKREEGKYFEVKLTQTAPCEATTQFEVTPGEQPPTPPPEQPPTAPEKKTKWLWLGLLFAGGLMLGLVAISKPKRRRIIE